MDDSELMHFLASITGARVLEVVRSIADRQPPQRRAHVPLGPVLEALTEGHDIGVGPRRAAVSESISEAVRRAIASEPELKFIEGGS